MLKNFFKEIRMVGKNGYYDYYLKNLKPVEEDDYILYEIKGAEKDLFCAIKKWEMLSLWEQKHSHIKEHKSKIEISAMIAFIKIWLKIFRDHIKSRFSLSSDIVLMIKKKGNKILVIWNSNFSTKKWKDRIVKKSNSPQLLYSEILRVEINSITEKEIKKFEPKEKFKQKGVGKLNDYLKRIFVVGKKFEENNMFNAQNYSEQILEAELIEEFPEALKVMFILSNDNFDFAFHIGHDWKVIVEENELI